MDVWESLLGQGNSKREASGQRRMSSRWESGGKEVREEAKACMSGLPGLG